MRYCLLPLFCLASLAPAADKKPAAKITYEEHILPLLKDKCINCHSQDKKRGGLNLANYTALMEGGSSGACVKPGDPEGSLLFKVTAHKAEPFMPPNSPRLPQANLDLIQQWIAGGALENAGSKPVVVSKPTTDVGLKSVVRGRPSGPPPMPPSSLRLDPLVLTREANAVTALAANPWSPLVAIGGQKQIVLHDCEAGEYLGVLEFPEGESKVLRFSRTGSLLLAGGGRAGKSGKVVLWSVTTGQRILSVGEETDSVLAADISPDQTQIALAGPGKIIRIYSTKDGKLLHQIKKHTDWVTALEYSPDGVLLATGDRNGGLFVWEAFTAREYFSLRGHTAAITEVSWREDSNVLASASEDSTVRLWEMENGNQIRNWGAHGGGTQSVRFAKNGKLVTTGRDRVTKIWDSNNGALQRSFEAFADIGLRSAWSHDDARVVASDWNGVVKVWLAADGKPAGLLVSNPPSVSNQFTTAARDLVSAAAARNQALQKARASKAVVDQVTAELATAQKLVADSANAIKTANDAVAAAKANLDRANAAVATAQADARALDVLVKALNRAVDEVKAQADKAPADKSLAAALTRARNHAGQAATDLANLQKGLPALTQAVQTTTAQLAVAQKKVAEVTSAAQQAPKQVEALTARLKSAQAQAQADEAAAVAATAVFDRLSKRVDRLKAALAVALKD